VKIAEQSAEILQVKSTSDTNKENTYMSNESINPLSNNENYFSKVILD
jgi:hypothetical protein